MAGNINNRYGTSNQTITLTCTIATASFRASTAIDNSSNVWVDVLVMVKVTAAAASTSSTGYVDVYAYGTSDGGSNYSGGVTGTDAAFTGQLSALVKIGRIAVIANNGVYTGGPFSIAAAFGGSLPDHCGICIDNESGATLAAGSAWYQGIGGAYT